MSSKSTITVVIPCFNSSKYIHETLNSVVNQSQAIEKIIIIDDNSKDVDSLDKIISLFKVRFKSIIFELIKNKQNFGPGICRNIAWNKVHTEYIAFIDSDDIWFYDKLEKQINLFKTFNVDLISTAKNNLTKFQKSGQLDLKKMLFKNIIPLSTVMIKSKVKFRFSESYYAEDYNLWLTMLSNNLKLYFLNEVLCKNNNNLSSNQKRLSDNIFSMFLYTQFCLSKIYKKKFNLIFFILIAQIFVLFKFFLKYVEKIIKSFSLRIKYY